MRTDTTGVVLLFRRSFADYTWRLLERTARSYRPCITSPAQCADPVFTPLFETV
jgi:sarcosine oxidase subunit gamma